MVLMLHRNLVTWCMAAYESGDALRRRSNDTLLDTGPQPYSQQTRTLRILLADDHSMVREMLVTLLRKVEGFEVVGQAGDGVQAVEAALRLQPDIVLMDVTMPHMNGFEATARIVQELPEICIIGLSMHNDAEIRQKMIDAGAMGFVCKDQPAKDLIAAIKSTCG